MKQVEFLAELHHELVDTFGDELGVALLGAAASELFAGPEGVTRMYERHNQTGKPIPAKRIPK